jgi:ferrous iron transport protein B
VFFPRPWWAPGLVLFSFYLLSFVATLVTGLIFKRVYPSNEAFVLELPPYRSPSLTTVLQRGWNSMAYFLRNTRLLIIIGSAAIWLLTHLPAADAIGHLFEPLLGPIGLNPELTVSLFFGFIAKEILIGAMAVVYSTSESNLAGVIQSAITPLQSLSFMTFVLLYTPCIGTMAAQLQESKSRRFALLSMGWSLLLAWRLAFVVYQGGLLILLLVAG